MKRFLGSVAVSAFVISLAATAFAFTGPATGTVHLKTDPVAFRVHAAALVQADFLGGYVDSVVTKRVGNGTMILDTTTAVSTYGWPVITNQAISDTSGFSYMFTVWDATGSGCESGADSIYVAEQGSVDGTTWFNIPTFKAGTLSSIASRLDQTNVTGAFFGALSLNGAALANGAPVWKVLYKQRAVTSWDRNDVGNVNAWPLLRWIVGFSDAKGYIVSAGVSHLSTEN